jgi:hypothetical protein
MHPPLLLTVARGAGGWVHRRGPLGVVHGDDGVDRPRQQVPPLALVQLQAVYPARPQGCRATPGGQVGLYMGHTGCHQLNVSSP